MGWRWRGLVRAGAYRTVGVLPLREAFAALDRLMVTMRVGSLLSGWRANGRSSEETIQGVGLLVDSPAWFSVQCYTQGPAAEQVAATEGRGSTRGGLMVTLAATGEATASATEVHAEGSRPGGSGAEGSGGVRRGNNGCNGARDGEGRQTTRCSRSGC